MCTHNMNKISLGTFKREAEILNLECSQLLRQGIWPMCVLFLKKTINIFVASLQKYICEVNRMDNNLEEALRIVEYFCFSLVIRITSIEVFRMDHIKFGLVLNNINSIDFMDFKTCAQLLFKTHPKCINFNCNLEVMYVEICKQEFSRKNILVVSNIVDLIVQFQFLLLLDPIIENKLPEHFYSFRRGRSVHQAVSFFYKSILLSDTQDYVVVTAQVKNFFDSISHNYIMDNFPFPDKYKSLLYK